jgi:hypothetical protein
VRLSVKKAAYADSLEQRAGNPGSVLGEPGPHVNTDGQSSKANPILFETHALPYTINALQLDRPHP